MVGARYRTMGMGAGDVVAATRRLDRLAALGLLDVLAWRRRARRGQCLVSMGIWPFARSSCRQWAFCGDLLCGGGGGHDGADRSRPEFNRANGRGERSDLGSDGSLLGPDAVALDHRPGALGGAHRAASGSCISVSVVWAAGNPGMDRVGPRQCGRRSGVVGPCGRVCCGHGAGQDVGRSGGTACSQTPCSSSSTPDLRDRS